MTSKKKPVSFLLLQNREIGAAEFKARCLEIIDEVERIGVGITITKHRRPMVRLVPIRAGASKTLWSSLKGCIVEEGDLISPIDVQWEAGRDATSS